MSAIQIHVDSDRDVLIGISGALNHATWTALRYRCRELEDIRVVRVDLAAVTSIDSAGIGSMLMIKDCVEKKNGKVVLVGAAKNPNVDHIIKLAHLDKIFTIE